MDEMSQDQLKRSSLGKIAFIGELYDVRSESLSSLSLLKANFPEGLVKITDSSQTEFQYKFTENSSDRFELIDVGADLQLSFLCGLITVDGSGKFLIEEKKSQKTVSCSLKCQIQTKNQKLFAVDDFIKHVNLDLLADPKYTHVVTEINWGANCLLNLEYACDCESSKEEIKGLLAAEFTKLKLIAAKGRGQLEKFDSGLLNNKDVSIKVFADVVPESGWPTTVEGFFKFVETVPTLLRKVNRGKGKPLNYRMIPLSDVRKRAKVEMTGDFIVRKIDEGFLTSIIWFFDDVGEMKQKFHDLCALFQERKQYVKDEDLKACRRMKEQLALKESELKSLISQDWVSVRSGQKSLKDLMKRIDRFRNSEFRLYAFEEYLNSCSTIVEKLSSVAEFLSQGILYLGKTEKLVDLQMKHPSSEFIVLMTSSEMQAADPELHTKTIVYFAVLARESRPDTKYVIVDFDWTDRKAFSKNVPTVTKCFHMKGTEILSSDLFSDYCKEIESNFIRPMAGSDTELFQHKPGNRVALKIPCPGFKGSKCSSDSVVWRCYVCKSDVEYGFDDFYYCACGGTPAFSFEYRCGKPQTHGNNFIPADKNFLEQALRKLTPLEEMNVLVIGQSGVGKSTWINSIVNYLSYDNLAKAKSDGVICTIPTEITVYDPNTYQKKVIKVGDESNNEKTDIGHSATQWSQTYTFLWEGRCVRIIDTPGMGDTRGINQDKINLKNIIDHIGHFKVLHGVCILLRANDNRFTPVFTYCIKELLVHLHKSVTKNMVFCFTHSRTSLYTPGQASVLLGKILRNEGIERELGLGKHNMFCLDNESFTFLCSLHYTDMEYEEEVEESFEKSWDLSSNETKRLFNTIKTFKPHLLQETLSLVKARNRVLFLTKPLAEVSKTIQLNVAAKERKKQEIETSNLTIEELQKKLNHTEIRLQSVALNRPRTVCTSSSCVDYLTYQGVDVKEIHYKTHCHRACFLINVVPKLVNNVLLKHCDAMDDRGYCKICRCSWENHMHLTYDQKRVEVTVENKFIKEDIKREESEKEKIENLMKQWEDNIQQYKNEHDVIIQASAKFGMFLKNNAISVYNDSIAEYLEYLIEEEKKKPCQTATEKKIIENMKETLDQYNAEVKILTEVLNMNDGKTKTDITPEDVIKLEEDLYKLKLMGSQIRDSVKLSRSSAETAKIYTEVPVILSGNKRRNRGKKNKNATNKDHPGNIKQRVSVEPNKNATNKDHPGNIKQRVSVEPNKSTTNKGHPGNIKQRVSAKPNVWKTIWDGVTGGLL